MAEEDDEDDVVEVGSRLITEPLPYADDDDDDGEANRVESGRAEEKSCSRRCGASVALIITVI